MTLKVYNTLERKKEDFKPLVPGKVTMYLCGPTVYKPAHIGHMVGPVIFDTIKRYLVFSGYDVKFVINITDIDDKLINKAAELGVTVKALAEQMTADYFENLAAMGVDTVDEFPYATDYIADMQAMIQSLIDKDHAYELDGDVYFSVNADKDYGKLSGRSVEQVLAGTRVEANERKRHPADFALWKGAREGEPAWDSPWGPGRPGWHIECSVMSCKLLGETIDIHGGGLDLMFPHHENELAQSESASGKTFVKYWLHNGLMQSGKQSGKVGGQHDRHGDAETSADDQIANKLAGSAGAESVKTAVFAHHSPEVVRFFLLSTHYRSPIDFSRDNIAATEKSMEGFYRLFESFAEATGQNFYELPVPGTRAEFADLSGEPQAFVSGVNQCCERFFAAMDDDFNTGGAVAVLFDLRRLANGLIDQAQKGLLDQFPSTDGKLHETVAEQLTQAMIRLKQFANLLGVFREPPAASNEANSELVDGLMQLILDLRANARQEKNWTAADMIRDRLTELQITVEDGRDGARWSRG